MVTKKGVIEVDGIVKESLPNTLFRVEVKAGSIEGINSDKLILCHLAGRLRLNYIKILPGDRVRIEISQYDLNRGRIIYRYK